jgi:hypothetical protein
MLFPDIAEVDCLFCGVDPYRHQQRKNDRQETSCGFHGKTFTKNALKSDPEIARTAHPVAGFCREPLRVCDPQDVAGLPVAD